MTIYKATTLSQAETIANAVAATAKDAWALARQRDSFQDACETYNQALLGALYRATEISSHELRGMCCDRMPSVPEGGKIRP